MKLSLALLCAAFALVAARQLHQNGMVTVADLPQNLQALNARLAGLVSKAAPTKADTMSLLSKYEEYDHYGKYDEPEPYRHGHAVHVDVPKYYYSSNKVAIKLFEKFRSKLRPQPYNPNTFQFTSELTCQNPNALEEVHHDDGIIHFPIVSERMKLVTVGVCEWTVNLVKEAEISEHATLKGNSNVICRFTEDAERHCPHAEDVLCADMTVSGQGLVYNFEAESLKEEEEEHEKYQKKYDEKYAQVAGKDKAAAVKGAEEEKKEGLDVYLTLINGVLNAKEHMKWETGAVQYFFGKPATVEQKGRDGSAANEKGDPTGEYTFVLKHA